MAFIKDLFTGPDKPKTIKQPATDTRAVQDAAADARRRAAMAKGRQSTDIVGRGLGTVG